MTQRRDPLGLLDIFWRDMERIFGTRRGSDEGNPGAPAAEAGNPVEVAMPPVPQEFNSMTGLLERKRQEWLAAGASPCLVRMGLDQAVSGAQGMARRMELFAKDVDKPAVMQDYIDNVADAWVRAMARSDEERRGDAL
ncbi:MAG: hypothetical protein AAB270_01570 [Chloroflexota bacterium]